MRKLMLPVLLGFGVFAAGLITGGASPSLASIHDPAPGGGGGGGNCSFSDGYRQGFSDGYRSGFTDSRPGTGSGSGSDPDTGIHG